MNMLHAKTVLHLAGPRVGNEVRKLVRELARRVEYVDSSPAHDQLRSTRDPGANAGSVCETWLAWGSVGLEQA